MTALSQRWVMARRSLRDLHTTLTAPQPRAEVGLRAWVPCWVLRLVLLAVGIGAVVALRPSTPVVPVLAGFVIAVVVRPGARSAALFVLASGVTVIIFPEPLLAPSSFVLLALSGAVIGLASTIDALPLGTRIEWRALWPSLRRFMIIQLISQPLVLATTALQGQSLGVLPLAIAAAVVVAVAIWVLLPRLSR